jgi:hypothetical protein
MMKKTKKHAIGLKETILTRPFVSKRLSTNIHIALTNALMKVAFSTLENMAPTHRDISIQKNNGMKD